jgi:hypothetical protein
MHGSRGSAHLVMKCKFCSRESSIEIVRGKERPFTADDEQSYVPFLTMDCRGMEPIEFEAPNTGFLAKSVKGTVFSEVDLSEGDWTDFDEAGNMSVGLYELTSTLKVTAHHK